MRHYLVIEVETGTNDPRKSEQIARMVADVIPDYTTEDEDLYDLISDCFADDEYESYDEADFGIAASSEQFQLVSVETTEHDADLLDSFGKHLAYRFAGTAFHIADVKVSTPASKEDSSDTA
jgi:hypothetical protein